MTDMRRTHDNPGAPSSAPKSSGTTSNDRPTQDRNPALRTGTARRHPRFAVRVWLALTFGAALAAQAAVVWTGPRMTFSRAGFANPALAANQDRITSNVWITRGNAQGIYNAKSEVSYSHNFSPAGTRWAYGTTANYASLVYKTWEEWYGGAGTLPGALVNRDAVLHLVAEDIYLDIKFTDWGVGPASGGSFTYERSTPSPVNLPPSVTITNPPDGASFTAPASVTIEASASDSDGSVTNVEFFAGAVSLGSDSASPYSVTANLPPGSHPLTAVATDNLGLSATSSVVNVTVSAGNSPPSVTITNPVENASLSGSANVNIQASASDSDGSVTNVQFFDGAVSLGNDATSPYSLSVRLALGPHTLTAVAFDNLGATGTSAPVHVTVARYLPPITNGDVAILLQPVATGMAAPLYGISPPGDFSRLFVVEQNGLLRIIENGVLLPGSALDLAGLMSNTINPANANDERGFLGLAFHPGYNNPASPGHRTLYTFNSQPLGAGPTYPAPNDASQGYKLAVNEWKISTTNANVVDPDSRREVISFGKTANNHNGGTITFGPDGYLYLALGDGGNAHDVGPSHIEPGGNAQNLSTPLGKMLRFDPLHPSLTPASSDPASANGQYRIPTTNPFQAPGQVPEIYALGLRNPYRFAFDRLNGELICADVGQNNIEEIDRIELGGNYGWAIKEGDFLFNRTNGPAGAAGTIGAPPGNRSPGLPAGLIDPISGPMGTLEYDHNDGISITGGFVYRGTAIPELYGKYVFGDLALRTAPVRADGRIFHADLQAGTINAFPLHQFGGSAILPNGLTVHGFGEDADGELYALVTNTSANGTGGIVYKLAPVRLQAQALGNWLNLSWPAPGARLQAQTNAPGVGLGANWVDVPGSTTTNRLVVPLDPDNGSVFYRLALP